jgi:hypothetical protein
MKKEKNKKSKMTIDKLAILTKAGFGGVNKKIDNVVDLVDKLAVSTLKGFEGVEARMATKEDLKNLATKGDLKIQQDVLQIMLKEIKAVHEDSKSFRDNISTLYTDHVAYDRRIENLTVRVEKLEMKS